MAGLLLMEAFANDASASNFSHSISLTAMLLNSTGSASAIESGITVLTFSLLPDLHVTIQELSISSRLL